MSDGIAPQKPTFHFDLNWKICVFSLFFFPILIGAGLWQLDRAEQKRTLQQLLTQRQAQPPLALAADSRFKDLDKQALTLRTVTVRGRLDDDHIWLLDNQMFNGKVGYHVIQPLLLDSGEAVLLDRGWLQSSGYRSSLPAIHSPSRTLSITGRLIEPSVNRLLMGDEPAPKWPRVILQVDKTAMEQASTLTLWPLMMQIDESDPVAFAVYWQNINMPASRHQGYAIQWFLMALALAVLTLFANSNLNHVIRAKFQE